MDSDPPTQPKPKAPGVCPCHSAKGQGADTRQRKAKAAAGLGAGSWKSCMRLSEVLWSLLPFLLVNISVVFSPVTTGTGDNSSYEGTSPGT